MDICLILDNFNGIVLSYKSILLLQFYFIFGPESQSVSLPYYGVRPPWWQHWRSINTPSGCEGLKSAATSQSLGNPGNWQTIGNFQELSKLPHTQCLPRAVPQLSQWTIEHTYFGCSCQLFERALWASLKLYLATFGLTGEGWINANVNARRELAAMWVMHRYTIWLIIKQKFPYSFARWHLSCVAYFLIMQLLWH